LSTFFTLAELGWASDFLRQIELDELASFIPCRIAAVHRSRVEAFSQQGALSLILPPGLSAGETAVGGWALSDGTRLLRLFDRRTCLARRAAGTGASRQLIAANVDTLFIVTSCNADFNPARLERYLALAWGAGVEPVILLTKADLAAEPDHWRERAEAVDRRVAVHLLDARAPDTERMLGEWCRRGRSVALAGSSSAGSPSRPHGARARRPGIAFGCGDSRQARRVGVARRSTRSSLAPACCGAAMASTRNRYLSAVLV
jgi:ribosome biogenesis GTPase / thiamine phosphate phosphatase